MPKSNSLSELFRILAAGEPPSSPHHFLFFLGTDTLFTAKQTAPEKSYERGETLSFTAQAIVSLLGENETAEIRPKGEALSYCSPSVDVLNGPTTLGTEVGERIAQGIFLALRAVASGKKTLQISAHSRGAVEATLVIHELARIKKTLAEMPQKSLKDILLESPSKLTRVAITKLFSGAIEGESPEGRALLLDRLNALEVNPFLIDPVPGDTTYALPGFGWHDDRFYHEVPCAHYELLLCRDERTACFYPILPKGMQPTIIPGHHGTASGNRYTQQYENLPQPLQAKETTSVQDLVLLKLFHFLHQRTKAFGQQDARLNTGNSALDRVANEFLSSDESTRKRLLLEQYHKVKESDDAYQHFTKTSYPFLGRALAPDGHRYFHDQGVGYKSMSTIAPEVRGPIVNTEHAKLYLADHVTFVAFQDAEPVVQVAAIDSTLKEMILQAKSVSTGEGGSALLDVISTPQGKDYFFNGLSILVDSISQKYLRNNLSVEEKLRLMDVITLPFTTLSTATIDEALSVEHRAIFQQCQDILQDGVKLTIETHYNSVLQQFKQLHQQMQLFLAPAEKFVDIFNKFWDALTIESELNGSFVVIDSVSEILANPSNDAPPPAEVDLHALFAEIKARLRTINPVTIETVQQALSTELKQIQQNNTLGRSQKEKLKSALFSEQSAHLQDYFEAHQSSMEQYLARMEQLHDAAVGLNNAYPQLKGLVGTKTLDVEQHQLFLHSSGMVNLAGSLLKEKGHNLRHKPETISANFYTLAKNQAIALGAASPEIEDLKYHKSAQDEAVASQQEEINRLKQQVEEHAEVAARDIDHLLAQKDLAINNLKDQQKQLSSKEEITCSFLIQNKLIPLTTSYLDHLLVQAHKYLPTINHKDLEQKLPASDVLKPAARNAYDKIKTKFETMQNLHMQLTTQEVVLPSKRIENFSAALATCQSDLKLHRDPAWKAYFTSCLAVLAIIATGVLPGIVSLAAYSSISGKSPLFFNQSKGEQYIEEINLTMSTKRSQ